MSFTKCSVSRSELTLVKDDTNVWRCVANENDRKIYKFWRNKMLTSLTFIFWLIPKCRNYIYINYEFKNKRILFTSLILILTAVARLKVYYMDNIHIKRKTLRQSFFF